MLANEQVIDGRGWRSGALVEKRELAQWFLKITDYSDELLSALDRLDRWPEKVRLMQRNWIGRSEGMRFSFALEDETGRRLDERLTVYTTRHDTIFGASFCAISADHRSGASGWPRTTRGLPPSAARWPPSAPARNRSSAPRRRAIRSASMPAILSAPKSALPVYAANFVLMGYGEGAIFGCPAHDQRDLDFARKYDLPVMPVVAPKGVDPASFAIGDEAFLEKEGDETVLINSDFLDGIDACRRPRKKSPGAWKQ